MGVFHKKHIYKKFSKLSKVLKIAYKKVNKSRHGNIEEKKITNLRKIKNIDSEFDAYRKKAGETT